MTAGLKYTLLAVVFLLGYTSMSFELLVLRQLINFVGSNTLITSVVITFILLFLSVGYYIGSVVRFAGSSNRRGSRMRTLTGKREIQPRKQKQNQVPYAVHSRPPHYGKSGQNIGRLVYHRVFLLSD